jgi:hypothetical protein
MKSRNVSDTVSMNRLISVFELKPSPAPSDEAELIEIVVESPIETAIKHDGEPDDVNDAEINVENVAAADRESSDVIMTTDAVDKLKDEDAVKEGLQGPSLSCDAITSIDAPINTIEEIVNLHKQSVAKQCEELTYASSSATDAEGIEKAHFVDIDIASEARDLQESQEGVVETATSHDDRTLQEHFDDEASPSLAVNDADEVIGSPNDRDEEGASFPIEQVVQETDAADNRSPSLSIDDEDIADDGRDADPLAFTLNMSAPPPTCTADEPVSIPNQVRRAKSKRRSWVSRFVCGGGSA